MNGINRNYNKRNISSQLLFSLVQIMIIRVNEEKQRIGLIKFVSIHLPYGIRGVITNMLCLWDWQSISELHN